MMKITPTIAAALMAAATSAPSVSALDPTFSMYVPLPDDDLLQQVFEKINSRAASPVTDMISVAVPTEGTVVYYDHWEDGFDLTADTTEVWGDGNASNGCAPNVAEGDCTDDNDKLKAGDVLILKNAVPCQSRSASQVLYDGGDLLQSTHPIVMTRAAYPAGPGSMMAGAVEVFDTSKWGTSFIAPVGENLRHTTSAYQFTALAVMAGEDGTEVTLNNKDTTKLDQGKSIIIRVDQSDTLTSTKPVQVHLITGDIGSTYELRWYALAPTNQWSTTAYAPVGDTRGQVKVALYNPSPTQTISVTCTLTGGQTADISVPPQQVRYSGVIRDNQAAAFESDDGIFFAFSATDTTRSGQIYDWGYPLMTGEQLTPQVVVGLGFGCTDNKCDTRGERSLVWVTTLEDAEVWVDFNNDGKFDDHFSVRALQGKTITDEDEDMSGAVIWATEKGDTDGTGSGVKLAAAWGQKAALSRSGDSKALDLGTVVVPFEPTYTSCSVEILEDADDNDAISTGDLVEETIEVLNVGNFAVEDDTFAVQTGGGIVKLKPMETRGDVKIYKTQYRVPLGEQVLGTCELVPYDPKDPVAPTEPENRNVDPNPKKTTQPPAPDTPSDEDKKSDQAYSKGDPHFKTFAGEMYDFHGECDLVLLSNPDFKDGLGMDIHIRTKIEAFWSSIESAAIKIGDDTMEIRADPTKDDWLWINSKSVATDLVEGEWNKQSLEGFLVRYKSSGPNTREANLYLQGAKEVMVFKTFKSFVRIDINHKGSDNYSKAVGLLGSHAHNGKRLGRDGKFIEDVNAFGQEWKVIPEEDGSLFHSYEGAVLGKKCVMPPKYHEGDNLTVASLRGRRLGAAALDEAAAERACNHLVDPEEIKACKFDVLATQDLNMASTW